MPTMRTVYWEFVMRHSKSILRLVPLHAFGHDVVHFLLGQFGEHWQRDAGGGVALRVGHGPGDARAFAPRITSLFVDRDGIMRLGVHAIVIEELNEAVALFGLFGFNDIEVEDVAIVLALLGQGETLCAFQAGGVRSEENTSELQSPYELVCR